jgi:hypothetical protein
MEANLLFFDVSCGHSIYDFKTMDTEEINDIITYVIKREVSRAIKPI